MRRNRKELMTLLKDAVDVKRSLLQSDVHVHVLVLVPLSVMCPHLHTAIGSHPQDLYLWLFV